LYLYNALKYLHAVRNLEQKKVTKGKEKALQKRN